MSDQPVAGPFIPDGRALGAAPSIGRRELLLWVTAIILANDVAGYVLLGAANVPNPLSYISQTGLSAFDLLAAGVALWRLSKSSNGPVSRLELAALLVITLIAIAPSRWSAPIALTALALLVAPPKDPDARSAAAILASISVHQIWGKALFTAISPVLLQIDAALVGTAVGIGVPGALWDDNRILVPGGHGIEVLEGCASFTNISAALLCWVAITKLERNHWVRRDLWVLGAMVLAQVLFNTARIYMMALSHEHYLYWHDGAGAGIYAVAATVAAVFISAVGSHLALARK